MEHRAKLDEGQFRTLFWRLVDEGGAAESVAHEAARARSSEERLAEWARYVVRQGCSGNARVCASDPCPACRAAADLLAAGLEVGL